MREGAEEPPEVWRENARPEWHFASKSFELMNEGQALYKKVFSELASWAYDRNKQVGKEWSE